MRITQPGRIIDGLDFLGTYESCLYLLRGEQAMVIGGGMSWIVPSLERQFETMGLEPEKVRYVVILHSHFDHCGAVPYLKMRFPHIEVIASAYAQKVLLKSNVINFIAAANKQMVDRLGLQKKHPSLNLDVHAIEVDRVVSENDVVDLGDGVKVHFMQVPGHTQCSIEAYVPRLKALFPSDAAPFPIDGAIGLSYPSPQHSFSRYLESLRKMTALDVEMYASEHHGAFAGDQAKTALTEGLRLAEEFQNRIVELYQQIGDVDRIANQISAKERELNKLEFLSFDLDRMLAGTKAEVRNVLRHAGLLGDEEDA